MKTMTKRELSRNPAKLSALKPGETMEIHDKGGKFTLKREKKISLTADEIEAEIQRICAGCPPIDTLACLQEGEE